jgi:hypothetical protein
MNQNTFCSKCHRIPNQCCCNTTPKELSDEEILALWVQKNKLNGAKDIIDFARAILKKASEK